MSFYLYSYLNKPFFPLLIIFYHGFGLQITVEIPEGGEKKMNKQMQIRGQPKKALSKNALKNMKEKNMKKSEAKRSNPRKKKE